MANLKYRSVENANSFSVEQSVVVVVVVVGGGGGNVLYSTMYMYLF